MTTTWLNRAMLGGAVALLALLLYPTLGLAPLFAAAWVLWIPLRHSADGRALLGVILLLLIGWILYHARWIVYPLIGGMLIAYWLDPFVDRLESWKLPRSVGAILSLLPIGLFFALVVIVLVPTLIGQFDQIATKVPGTVELIRGFAEPWLERLSALAGSDAGSTSWIEKLFGQIESILKATLTGVSGLGRGVSKVMQWMGVLILTPVLAYYLLVDWDRIRDGLVGLVPPRVRPAAQKLNDDIQEILPRYLRGQFFVAAIQVVLYSVGFYLAGLPEPFAIGFLAGIFSLVPVLGFWITVLVVLLSTIIAPDPAQTLLGVAIALAVVQFLEGQILVPRIQGTGLGLHPFVVLLSVLTFGMLFGFVGVLIAVPTLGVLRASLPRIMAGYRESAFYAGNQPAEDERPS